jgi:hypothetical protein
MYDTGRDMKTAKIVVRLTPEEKLELRQQAKEFGCPMSELVRYRLAYKKVKDDLALYRKIEESIANALREIRHG